MTSLLKHEEETRGRQFYGTNKEFIEHEGFEAILSGAAETGKTFAALHKLNKLAEETPGGQFAIIRKTRTSMDSTVLRSFKRIINPEKVEIFGGERPQWYDYWNGARVWVAGMDSPNKVLSGERDGIYVNQAEELTLADWETLTTRATGRGAVRENTQIFGDCNPSGASHWIPSRAREGKLRLFESRHIFNPTLYFQHGKNKGKLTLQGHKTMKALMNLTGVRKARLLDGRWANAEGAIYEFDPLKHIVDPFPIPGDWDILISIDFGYVNPFSVLWFALDPDGRMYLFRYIYQTQKIVSDHADEMKRLIAHKSEGEWQNLKADSENDHPSERDQAYLNSNEWKRTVGIVSDHDAEDRATLNKAGFKTYPADKRVKIGIENVQERLALQGDGRARLFIMRNALSKPDDLLIAATRAYTIEQEFDSYVWLPAGENKTAKEEPLKKDDHALDALRYAVMHLDKPRYSYGF